MLPGSRGIWISYGKILIFRKDSAQSLTILSFVKSPPPIQFPDLTVAILQLIFSKKDFL